MPCTTWLSSAWHDLRQRHRERGRMSTGRAGARQGSRAALPGVQQALGQGRPCVRQRARPQPEGARPGPCLFACPPVPTAPQLHSATVPERSPPVLGRHLLHKGLGVEAGAAARGRAAAAPGAGGRADVPLVPLHHRQHRLQERAAQVALVAAAPGLRIASGQERSKVSTGGVVARQGRERSKRGGEAAGGGSGRGAAHLARQAARHGRPGVGLRLHRVGAHDAGLLQQRQPPHQLHHRRVRLGGGQPLIVAQQLPAKESGGRRGRRAAVGPGTCCTVPTSGRLRPTASAA
jgi:hypothetical protein